MRAPPRGRLTEDQLLHFRQEVDGKGLSSYPHPWLMPDFWQFPTVSMGLGPMMAIYQARFRALPARPRHRRHREAQGLGLPRRRRDGRAGVARRDHDRRRARSSTTWCSSSTATCSASTARCAATARSSRSSKARSSAPAGTSSRWSGARLGSAARARHEGPAAPAHGGVRRRRVPELQGQGRRLHARALLRQVPGAQGDGRQHVRRRHLARNSRRPRRSQGLRAPTTRRSSTRASRP